MGALSSRLLLDWTEKDKILFLVVFCSFYVVDCLVYGFLLFLVYVALRATVC